MAEVVFDDSNSLFDFVVKKGHGIKGLVDSGIVEVPQLYIRPQNDRLEKTNNNDLHSSSEHIPVSVPIDLSKLDSPEHHQVVDAVVRASETLGFFQVINHGVDLELLESLKVAAHRFFGQPASEKAVYLKGSSPTPFVKYSTSFSPEKEKVLEWRDFVSLIYTNDDDAEKYWPKACKKEILEHLKLCSKTARRLVEILIENLGVEEEESMVESLMGLEVVNMNYYPVCPNPELTIGAGRHSDMGTLTLLLQDEIGGLYVKVDEDIQAGKKEEWVEIPPIPGALVVNLGDTMQILSNDRYKSAEHKVHTTTEQTRVSIPYFVSPKPTEKIGPLPQLVERDGKTPYKEVVVQDYMNNYFGRAHDGKIHLDLAKINYTS